MNFSLIFLLFVNFFAWSQGMLYRRDSDNILKPDLQPISSTVEPLPFYSVYGFEKKLRESKYKTQPLGKIVLLTKSPE